MRVSSFLEACCQANFIVLLLFSGLFSFFFTKEHQNFQERNFVRVVDLPWCWKPTHFLWEEVYILSVWPESGKTEGTSFSYFSVLMPKIKLVTITSFSSHGLIIEPMLEHSINWRFHVSFQERNVHGILTASDLSKQATSKIAVFYWRQ